MIIVALVIDHGATFTVAMGKRAVGFGTRGAMDAWAAGMQLRGIEPRRRQLAFTLATASGRPAGC